MADRSLRRSARGYTFIEGLIATLILAVSIVGIYGLWSVSYLRILHAGEVSEAGELARQELERAKVFGADNFPMGTFNSGTQTGTWDGSYDPAANSNAGGWVSGATTYYGINGNRLAMTDDGVRFSVHAFVTDSHVLANGTSYTIDNTSRRAIVVTVNRMPDNTEIFTAGTNLAKGGL